MNRILITRVIAATALMMFSLASVAQGYPSGGGSRAHGGGTGSTRIDQRPDTPAKRPESQLRPDAVALFAAALDKESASLGLSPGAASALQGFVRDMKDYGALGDRLVQQRMGWTQPAVHANVDVARELDAARESMRELDGAAADVASDWKKLVPLLDETQRRRVEALYANALLEARRPAATRN